VLNCCLKAEKKEVLLSFDYSVSVLGIWDLALECIGGTIYFCGT